MITNLAQGATNSATLQVGVDTSSAGARSGTANLALASNGSISGLTDLALPSQTINVSGNVYQVAAGQIVTAPLNFGTVQVGQAVSQNLSHRQHRDRRGRLRRGPERELRCERATRASAAAGR